MSIGADKLMDSPRSSGATSDHLHPPPSPYPATVDPSPVDSNGTVHTDHTEVCTRHDLVASGWGLILPKIEDDAQVNHVGEEDMSDITSPATDDIVSPTSQDSHAKPHKLVTVMPPRTRADSDDAPPSVIHAPANFKDFVRIYGLS